MTEPRNLEKFVIRLPDGLRPDIYNAACKNHRSMNGEIIYRLERSLALELALDQRNRVIAQLLNRITELEVGN